MKSWIAPLPRLDLVLAGSFLVVGEIELLLDSSRSNPAWVDVLAMAGLMTSLAWRRRAPLAAACAAAAFATCLSVNSDITSLNAPMVVLFVPPYSVARHEPLRRALFGLTVCLVVPMALFVSHGLNGNPGFNVGMVAASWAVGRVIRSEELKATLLRRHTVRAMADWAERERLVVADERARIAVELQTVVVDSVSNMVVEAETAARLLESAPEPADACMSSVEETARQVLYDMRRVLGILRSADTGSRLSPLPGIAEVGSLRGRDGRRVVLRVEGTTSVVPAVVELVVHRVVEAALDGAGDHARDVPLMATVMFTEASIELQLDIAGQSSAAWPTPSMLEWVTLCHGEVVAGAPDKGGNPLTMSIPKTAEVFA